MATSREVYNRIRWDARYDPARFTIGYRDRADGAKEKRLLAWDGTIPWHRVLWFALDGVRVWDRDAGLDRVTSGEALAVQKVEVALDLEELPVASPGRAAEELPLPFRLVTWNVLSGRHAREVTALEPRIEGLLATLRARDADVIALQEVTPAFLSALRGADWVRAGYAVSDPEGTTLKPEGQVLVARAAFRAGVRTFPNGKRVLVGTFHVGGRGLAVHVVHLTSDLARDARAKRALELDTVVELAGDRDALIVGDLNARDEDPGGLVAAGWTDAWRALRSDAGWTFDPAVNDLAARVSASGVGGRFDRVLARGALEPVAAEAFDGPSDHSGLSVSIDAVARIDDSPTVRTALAVLAPASVDVLRRVHDPAFARWPPHLNVAFGFVPEARLEEARALLARSGLGAFTVTLARFGVFEHADDATVHLVAEGEGLERLHDVCARRFPACVREDWTPHVTVGRFPSVAEARAHAERLQRGWEPVAFVVRSLALLAKRERFEVVHEVPLAGTLGRWLAGLPAANTTRVPVEGAEVVGSAALGIGGGDLDLACPEGDLDGIARALAPVARDVRVARDAHVPVVRATVDGVALDAIVGEPAREAIRERDALRALAAPRFREVLALVRAWARARRLDSQAWGYPAGTAWAVLVAWGLRGFEGGLEEALAHVFARGASHVGPMALDATGWTPGPHDHFPVLTVAAPHRNAARAVTASTRAVLERELARAAGIAQGIVAGHPADELATPPDPRSECSHVLHLSGGGLERVGLGVVLALERAQGVRFVRPYPMRGVPRVAIGLVADDMDAVRRAVASVSPEVSRVEEL